MAETAWKNLSLPESSRDMEDKRKIDFKINEELRTRAIDEYVENTLMSVLQMDIMDEFCELTNMKGRGNSTWEAPKKPYAIKFDKKKSLMD